MILIFKRIIKLIVVRSTIKVVFENEKNLFYTLFRKLFFVHYLISREEITFF